MKQFDFHGFPSTVTLYIHGTHPHARTIRQRPLTLENDPRYATHLDEYRLRRKILRADGRLGVEQRVEKRHAREVWGGEEELLCCWNRVQSSEVEDHEAAHCAAVWQYDRKRVNRREQTVGLERVKKRKGHYRHFRVTHSQMC